MKYFVKFFVITFLLFAFNNAFAENKIIYVDMDRVLNESKVGKSVQKTLTNIHKKNLDLFKKTEDTLKKEEKDLLSKKNVMKKEEFAEKIQALRKKAQDYQNERKKRLDEITSKRSKARTEILKTLQSILAKYADQNQISLILDKKEIVIGKKNLEATDEIIIELDKKLSSIKLN